MITRYAWYGFIALVALIVTGAELDRATRRAPHLVPLVPGIFRSFAQMHETVATVRKAPPDVALATARTLVERRPVPAEHLTLLAIAEERAGHREKSGYLIQAAARRGWREPLAQEAMFNIALMARDPAESARRLVAIMSTQSETEALPELVARQLATPAGRQAMAAQLATGGRWTGQFLPALSAVDRTSAIDMLNRAETLGARLDCRALAMLQAEFDRSATSGTKPVVPRGHCTGPITTG